MELFNYDREVILVSEGLFLRYSSFNRLHNVGGDGEAKTVRNKANKSHESHVALQHCRPERRASLQVEIIYALYARAFKVIIDEFCVYFYLKRYGYLDLDNIGYFVCREQIKLS